MDLTFITSFSADGSLAGSFSAYSSIIMLVLVVAFFYFLILRPQKKQEKKEQEMRNSLEVGDEVITNGGIVGIIFSIKDDTVVIETGSDRSKIRVMKWAIARNNTVHDSDEK